MFSERLRQTREAQKLSVRSLATKADLSPSSISAYEKGKHTPSQEMVVRLALALNVSSDYLIGLTDDPTPPHAPQELSSQERALIAALRAGNKEQAIRLILADE